MTFVVSVQPSVEPVSVSDAKIHARISGSSSNSEITAMIKAARQQAELELHRYLITQTVEAYFDGFSQIIELPPVQSIESITYIDSNGNEQTLSPSLYRVDSKSQPARITEAYGVTWPSTQNVSNAVKITFVAGYGGAEDVPSCIKQWILLRVEHYYDNRGANIVGSSISEFGRSYIDGLLDPERVMKRV